MATTKRVKKGFEAQMNKEKTKAVPKVPSVPKAKPMGKTMGKGKC